MFIINAKELGEEYKSDYEDIVKHMNVYHKESERHAADLKQSTADFEYAAKITINSTGKIIQETKIGMKIVRQVCKTKMRLIRVMRKTRAKSLKKLQEIK